MNILQQHSLRYAQHHAVKITSLIVVIITSLPCVERSWTLAHRDPLRCAACKNVQLHTATCPHHALALHLQLHVSHHKNWRIVHFNTHNVVLMPTCYSAVCYMTAASLKNNSVYCDTANQRYRSDPSVWYVCASCSNNRKYRQDFFCIRQPHVSPRSC